jgi:hypothetical protein
VRPAADAALAALAAHVQDGRVAHALVAQLAALLGGASPEGKVKVAGERVALANALAALSALPAAAAAAGAAEAAVDFCSTHYKEERE